MLSTSQGAQAAPFGTNEGVDALKQNTDEVSIERQPHNFPIENSFFSCSIMIAAAKTASRNPWPFILIFTVNYPEAVGVGGLRVLVETSRRIERCREGTPSILHSC